MRVNRKALLDVLNTVKPGIATKDVVEEMTHFLFSGRGVTTYNDQLCVHSAFPTDFSCSVKAVEFQKIITSFEDEEIELRLKTIDNPEENEPANELYMEETNSSGGLPVSSEENILKYIKEVEEEIIKAEAEGMWKMLPDTFLKGAELCQFSASKDETFGAYTCIYFDGSTILCGENFRISRYEMGQMIDTFLIKAISIPQVKRLAPVHYGLSDSWVHFRNEQGVRISVRLIKLPYPTDKFLPLFDSPYTKGTVDLPSPELKKCVEFVAILLEDDKLTEKIINLEVQSTKMVATMRRKGGGWLKRSLDIKYNGEPIQMRVNPKLLVEVISSAETKMLIGEGKAMFRTGPFRHIISLYGK